MQLVGKLAERYCAPEYLTDASMQPVRRLVLHVLREWMAVEPSFFRPMPAAVRLLLQLAELDGFKAEVDELRALPGRKGSLPCPEMATPVQVCGVRKGEEDSACMLYYMFISVCFH